MTTILLQKRHIVEIVTSDAATGAELGRTHWSGEGTILPLVSSDNKTILPGPGTLTMSTISSAAAKNIFNFNKILNRATPPPYKLNDDVELFEVPEEHQESNKQFPHPPAVIGTVCRSQYDCSGALRAVCAIDTNCRVITEIFYRNSRNILS